MIYLGANPVGITRDLPNTSIIDDTAGNGDTDVVWSADKSYDELQKKYEKPNSGIPASDIESGVIPVLTDLIDDTAGNGDTTKVWSADKSYDELNGLTSALNANRTMIADTESSTTAASAHAKNSVFILNDKLYMATAAIAVGDTIVTTGTGQNVVEVTIAEAFPIDVQVNGTSVVSSGVATIPIATGVSSLGVVKGDANYGIQTAANGTGILMTLAANDSQVKAGAHYYSPVVPVRQHAATFYGLAKAAGDSTQSGSSNSIGTYTETAKSAISQMLDAPETVSGSTPSITAKAGVRYICGECSTLTIVVPASGCIDVVFESGSTPTVLTVTPPTGVTAVKWANGFDPTSLESNTIYEISILDGELGAALSWT